MTYLVNLIQNLMNIVEFLRTFHYEGNMNLVEERWVSGLNQWFAKPPKELILSEGSNPSLSAIN